jgi:esterase
MKLFIRRFGQGFPVIILHGLLGLSDNWVSFGRRLASDFEVIIPDLRNHGQSPHSSVFDYPSLLGDLQSLIDELELREFFLIGHSLGGKIAMDYALESPERLKKLVVVDISLRKYPGNSLQQELIDAMLAVDFSVVHSRSGIDDQLKRYVRSDKLRQFLLKNAYWSDKDHLAWRSNINSINENLPLIFDGIVSDNKFENPALFIRGGLSDYISEDDRKEITIHFPDSSVSTIANATHWVHADAPEEFYNIVKDFLT